MKVLIGAPVRTSERIFAHYLAALKPLHADTFFFLHDSPALADQLLPGGYEHVTSVEAHEPHKWTPQLLTEVALMKNRLLEKAMQDGYDYFFLVDSDTVVHPHTLERLLSREKEIIAEVLWTKWREDGPEMPNAWMANFYEFGDVSPNKFRSPGVYEVGMVGGCNLIHRSVMKAGVNYNPIYNLSYTAWEDRAFCVRAAVHGFKIYLDTTLPATHLYRHQDVESFERDI
jgi:hypothetical protein